ncbi:hypothetical protein DV452_002022 [Geotrichum candidum]|nr:hypothetical protein DV452_002022 [Geotrichum candidum]KAI9213185.1 hypothetical protein DS838_001909 [Geotrichum bryndzae]
MAQDENQPQTPASTPAAATPTTTAPPAAAAAAATTPDNGSKQDQKKIEDLKFYPDTPTEFHHKVQFQTKMPSQFYDPCEQASKMSMNCLVRNDYDRDMCLEYFRAYKECRQEWMDQRKKDRRSGFKW